VHVFLDANIFLSFFLYPKDDLAELDKLLKLINDKEITLHVNSHLRDEVARNRERKINEGLANFRKLNFAQRFPEYAKDFPEYDQLLRTLKGASALHAKLIAEIDKSIIGKTLQADRLISMLFESSPTFSVTSEIEEAAIRRCEKGQPPGKSGSIGDAIHWETLISSVPARHHLHVISEDVDFRSSLWADQVSEFLFDEWERRKSSRIVYHSGLSGFFSKYFAHIIVAVEHEKDALIDSLTGSTNFAESHGLIAKLASFENFTKGQIERIFFALLNNNQISWIATDDDVKTFYMRFVQTAQDSVSAENLRHAAFLLEISEDAFDYIPF
jgi:PIN domain